MTKCQVDVQPSAAGAKATWTDEQLINTLGADVFELWNPQRVNRPHVVVYRQPTPDAVNRDRTHVNAFSEIVVVIGDPKTRIRNDIFAPWVAISEEKVTSVATSIKTLAGRVVDCMRVAKCLQLLLGKQSAPDSNAYVKRVSGMWNEECAMLKNPFQRPIQFVDSRPTPARLYKLGPNTKIVQESESDSEGYVLVALKPTQIPKQWILQCADVTSPLRVSIGILRDDVTALSKALAAQYSNRPWKADLFASIATNSAAARLVETVRRYPKSDVELAKIIDTGIL